MTEKQRYYALQVLVCEQMPYYAADLAVRAGYPASLKRMQNVKYGKAISLTYLVALVHHSLPEFERPAHLLPEAQQEPVSA